MRAPVSCACTPGDRRALVLVGMVLVCMRRALRGVLCCYWFEGVRMRLVWPTPHEMRW